MYFLRLGRVRDRGKFARGARRGAPTASSRFAPSPGPGHAVATPTRDRALEEELRANEKERAEHVMLVDLGRNDVGRVAEFGTVETNEHA